MRHKRHQTAAEAVTSNQTTIKLRANMRVHDYRLDTSETPNVRSNHCTAPEAAAAATKPDTAVAASYSRWYCAQASSFARL